MRTKRGAALALASVLGIVGCSGGGDGGGGGGESTALRLTGGAATGAATGDGGDGGSIYVETYTPGGVKFKRSGGADTSFSVPNLNAPVDLGSNGVTVSTSVTVAPLAFGADDPGADILYVVPGYWSLYKGDGGGTVPDGAEVVTGISVQPGATLTLGLNYNSGGNAGADMAYVQLGADIEIAGTLKAAPITSVAVNTDTRHGGAATARDSGAIYLELEQLFVRSGGKIDLRGGDATVGSDERGGDGGNFWAYANNLVLNDGTIDVSGGKGDGTGIGGDAAISSGWGNWLELDVYYAEGGPNGGGGVILNRGGLLASGGVGASGGACAYVGLYANSSVYNTGPISASGGDGVSGAGGSGGCYVELDSYFASVFNSGSIVQTGGDGATGGGNGGGVYVYGALYRIWGWDGAGDIVNSGAIDVSGGSATTTGNGGSGGGVEMEAAGHIRTSGALTLDGGAGKGASYAGGYGGYMRLESYAPSDWYYGYELPVRPIQISGNLSLVGGASLDGQGGDAGSIDVYQGGNYSAVGNAGIEFLGYASADLSGADGSSAGGDADSYAIEVYTYANSTASGYTPAGSIENEMDVTARGGNATGASGDGGTGAEAGLYFEVSSWDMYVPGTGFIRNSGPLDFSGGRGTGSGAGGDSGGLHFYAPGDVTNGGRILNRGGDAVDGSGGVGNWYECRMASASDVVNTGEIITDGGTGADGGAASDGWWYSTNLYAGGQVRNSATLSSKGGLSTDATSGSSGAGGHIELFSESKPTQNTGRLVVAPGDGGLFANKGEVGEIWIDWVNMTPVNGVM